LVDNVTLNTNCRDTNLSSTVDSEKNINRSPIRTTTYTLKANREGINFNHGDIQTTEFFKSVIENLFY